MPTQGLRSGGRGGLAHRLDLLCRKGRSVSSRPIFFLQQLNFHGRFAQFLAQTGELAVTAIARLVFRRFLACVEKCLTPGGETGGKDPQLARPHIEGFPTQQTEDDLGLLPCGKPLGFLPLMLALLSSPSMSSLRGELDG